MYNTKWKKPVWYIILNIRHSGKSKSIIMVKRPVIGRTSRMGRELIRWSTENFSVWQSCSVLIYCTCWYMTLSICPNSQNCTALRENLNMQILKTQVNGSQDGMQKVTKQSNFVTNVWNNFTKEGGRKCVYLIKFGNCWDL